MDYRDILNELLHWHELRQTLSGPDIIRTMEKRIQEEHDPEALQIFNSVLAREHLSQGNEAAAKAILRKDPVYRIHRWHRVLQRRRRDIVRAIEERIPNETGPQQLQALRWLLANEHRRRGNYASAEVLYLQLFDQNDYDPMPLISLAGQKLYWEHNPREAMAIIDRAIEAAYCSGLCRRQALSDKARIALELKQYSVVEDVLKKIMALPPGPGADTGVERDFFDRLPPGAISADVAREYEQFCRINGKTKTSPLA